MFLINRGITLLFRLDYPYNKNPQVKPEEFH